MNSAAFLLAIAAPTAATVAGRLVATTQAVGSTFSDLLGAFTSETVNAEPAGEVPGEPTLSESFQNLASELRTWLGEHDVTSDYSIAYRLESEGESQVDVTGNSAERVKQLLASKPDWLAKLRQIAAAWQAQTASLDGSGLANSANIEINEVDSRLS